MEDKRITKKAQKRIFAGVKKYAKGIVADYIEKIEKEKSSLIRVLITQAVGIAGLILVIILSLLWR